MNNRENGYGLLRGAELAHVTRITALAVTETKIASLMGRSLPREVAETAAGGIGLRELVVNRPKLWKPTKETTERTKDIGYAIRVIETYMETPALLVDLRLALEGYRQGHLGTYLDTTTESVPKVKGAVARQNGGKMSPKQRDKARQEELEQIRDESTRRRNNEPVDGFEIRKHTPINKYQPLGVGVKLRNAKPIPQPRQPKKGAK